MPHTIYLKVSLFDSKDFISVDRASVASSKEVYPAIGPSSQEI